MAKHIEFVNTTRSQHKIRFSVRIHVHRGVRISHPFQASAVGMAAGRSMGSFEYLSGVSTRQTLGTRSLAVQKRATTPSKRRSLKSGAFRSMPACNMGLPPALWNEKRGLSKGARQIGS